MPLQLPNSIFYHFPKTGGTWVKNAFRQADIQRYSLGHRPHSPEPLEVNEKFESARGMFSFVFIRNPCDWYKSFFCFRHLKKDWKPKDHKGFEPIDDCESENFGEFIENCTSRHPAWLTERFRPYMDVDFIGKQENLVDDLVKALNAAGEFFDEELIRSVRPINQSASLPVSGTTGNKYGDRAAWTPELRQLVYKSEKELFELYDYSQKS